MKLEQCTRCQGTGCLTNSARTEVACGDCKGTGKLRSGTDVKEGLKALRKRVNRTKAAGDRFTDGTVIRWVSCGYYTYTALRARGQWWLTGSANFYGLGKSGITYDQLTKILAREDVSGVAVSSEWANL
jgi:hypothetical protein